MGMRSSIIGWGSHCGGEGPFKRGSSVRRGFYYGVGVPLKGSHSGEGSHYGGRFPLWGVGPIMGGFPCVWGWVSVWGSNSGGGGPFKRVP